MQTETTPITKNQSRIRNDLRATSRYARRKDIDRLLDERRLESATEGAADMKKFKKGRCAVIHADSRFGTNIGKIVTIHQVLVGGGEFVHPIQGTRHPVPHRCDGMALVSGDIRCISGPHHDGIAAYSLDALVVIDDARFPQ